MGLAARLKGWAKALKREATALKAAALDPRTPWLARWLMLGTLAYALSPVDLIPDFIPALGQLGDVVLAPFGLWLALRMIPAEVLKEHRERRKSREIAVAVIPGRRSRARNLSFLKKEDGFRTAPLALPE